jgi:putative peptide zinc metalloprotease protein
MSETDPIPLRSGPVTRAAEAVRPDAGGLRAGGAAGPPRCGPGAPGPDSSQFSSDRMLRPRAVVPGRGWRLAVHRLTFGLVNPGPGRAERRERELVARVRRPIAGRRLVAVISRKGGIGKTTTVLGLGHTFASWRGDRVLAVDANPDAGSLGARVERQTASTLTQLLRDAAGAGLKRYPDVRAHTSQSSSRLEVVASDNDPAISVALGEGDYQRALQVLEYHYNLILLDTGTGILDSATQGVLRLADQLVVCAMPAIDGGRVAAQTLDWLVEHGHGRKAREAVVVINQVGRVTRVDVRQVEDHFARRCRAVIRIPWDPHLATGAEVSLADMRRRTRSAYLALAAAVADGFAPAPASACTPRAAEKRRGNGR